MVQKTGSTPVTNTNQHVSLYLNGAQAAHTERQALTEASYTNVSYPFALQARLTGVTAGQTIDVRWRTSGGTATMHERTLVVAQIPAVDTSEASATDDPPTTSTTDVLVSGMTLTPGAGDYLIWFSGSLQNTTTNFHQRVSLYVNGAQVAHTQREIFTEGSIPNTSFPIATHAYVTGLGAGQTIDVRWRTEGGTATMHERTLVIQKLASGSGATFTLAEDTKLTDLAKSTIQRIRFGVSNEGVSSSGPVTYELQVAETATCSAGSYATVPTGSAGHWQVIDSSFITDGEATSDISPGLTNDATTFVAGQLKDTGNTTGSITLASDEFTEIEFAVQATTNATDGGDYCFRLYDATNNQVLDTYTVYAEVQLAGGGPSGGVIYYSVGTDNTALYSGNASASAGTLTLSSPAANKIGVGDEIRVGLNRYYITGRSSPTVFDGGNRVSHGTGYRGTLEPPVRDPYQR